MAVPDFPKTTTITLGNGSELEVEFEDWQPYEPSAYCHEAVAYYVDPDTGLTYCLGESGILQVEADDHNGWGTIEGGSHRLWPHTR